LNIIGKSDFIDFSSFENPETIIYFFSIFNGSILDLDKIPKSLLFKTILFLDIEQLKPIVNLSSENMLSYSLEEIHQIFSSSFLHMENENEIFQTFFKLIEKDKNNLDLISYIYIGMVDYNLLNMLISDINFCEITEDMFNHFKNSLSLNFFIHHSEEATQLELKEIISYEYNIDEIIKNQYII
jgi:hypothetical protein